MRGAPSQRLDWGVKRGIIPADAGSTPMTELPALSPEDHPRGCGEHSMVLVSMCLARGSSPRMRGAQRHRRGLPGGQGIIPADAGSTVLGRLVYFDGKDHPRGCGEHQLSENNVSFGVGSSPRMRGALQNPA